MKKNIIILGLISLLAVSCGDDFLTTLIPQHYYKLNFLST